MTIWIGVDPGTTGGIAFLRPDGARVFELPSVPVEGGGLIKRRLHAPALYQLLMQHASGDTARAVIEAVGVGAGMGEKRGSTQTLASQHCSFEVVRSTLELVGVPYVAVPAQRWKKLYGLVGKNADDATVEKTLALARQLYPELEPDLRFKNCHNKADAVLLAHWGTKGLA